MDPPDVLKDLPKVLQDSPEDLQDPPEVLQDPPELLQDPSDVLQELPEVIQVPPEILQDSPEVLQDPPDVLQDSPEVLQISPEVIQASPEVIQVSPEVIQVSPEVLQEVIQDPPDPRQSISSNAEDSAEQKSDPDLTLADAGSIDRKETESSESSSDSDSCEGEPPREMITKEHKPDQENAPEFEWDSDFHQSSDDEEEEIIAKKDSQKKKHLFMDLRDYYCTSKLPKVSKYEGPPVDTKDLEQIGKVSGNVDIIVKVLALRNKKQLDLDSWLFRIDGSSLGQIFDVWGKVEEPTYNIRFDAPEEIEALQLQPEEPIFYVPSNKDLTKLIDLEAIQSVKGSDASWKNDVEIPPEMEEFSDDEKENEAKRKKKKKKTNTSQNVSEQHSSHYSQSRPSYRLGQYNQITRPRYSHHNSTPNVWPRYNSQQPRYNSQQPNYNNQQPNYNYNNQQPRYSSQFPQQSSWMQPNNSFPQNQIQYTPPPNQVTYPQRLPNHMPRPQGYHMPLPQGLPNCMPHPQGPPPQMYNPQVPPPQMYTYQTQQYPYNPVTPPPHQPIQANPVYYQQVPQSYPQSQSLPLPINYFQPPPPPPPN